MNKRTIRYNKLKYRALKSYTGKCLDSFAEYDFYYKPVIVILNRCAWPNFTNDFTSKLHLGIETP